MSNQSEKLVVKISGEDFHFHIEPYTELRDFVTSDEFSKITSINPNKLTFFVNGDLAEDDLLLVSGDLVTFDVANKKALISAREAIKKLKRLVGLQFHRHGGSHDIWRTQDNRQVVFPRHAGDLDIGTLNSIIKQAGLDMNVNEFLAV
jgi:predicted RNA binding protein YcfA (HicA-like mRNA interferase family)